MKTRAASSRRILYLLAVIVVVLVALGVRLYAVQRLNVDYDEPVYLSAAVEYAKAMRTGDLKMLAWSEHTYEHPALQKILYGLVLLAQTPLDRLPESDLPRLAPIASAEAGPWNVAARHLAAAWGTLAVLALAIVNPLAGLFLGIDTLSVKYTSEVYLEALPLLTGLLSAICYLKWFGATQSGGRAASEHRRSPHQETQGPGASRSENGVRWLILSAVFLGMTAAGKYVHAIVALAILLHFLLAVAQGKVAARLLAHVAGWGVLSLLMFFLFDPYLWPHPLERLSRSLLFHRDFQDSRLVGMYDYPFWQPLRWLAAFSSYYELGPGSAFPLNIDTFIFVAALVGLPRLFRKEPLYFWWLVIGLGFLLLWTTKWPQYTLVILAPFSMAAAQGLLTLLDLAQRAHLSIAARST